MTSTHQNQPTIPRLQINLDETLGTIALELARVRICDQCQQSVPSLINDLARPGRRTHPARRRAGPGPAGPGQPARRDARRARRARRRRARPAVVPPRRAGRA